MHTQPLHTDVSCEAYRFLVELCMDRTSPAGQPTLSSTCLLSLDIPTRTRLQIALEHDPRIVRALFATLSHSQKHIARWAYHLALELGAPCGHALATLLPDILLPLERQLPANIATLRQLEMALLAAIDLIERLVPQTVAALYRVMNEQRGKEGVSPWWTFRVWRRLTEALQMRVAAGERAAVELVLEVLAAGAQAPPSSAAHWRASWAAHQLVPFLSTDCRVNATCVSP